MHLPQKTNKGGREKVSTSTAGGDECGAGEQQHDARDADDTDWEVHAVPPRAHAIGVEVNHDGR